MRRTAVRLFAAIRRKVSKHRAAVLLVSAIFALTILVISVSESFRNCFQHHKHTDAYGALYEGGDAISNAIIRLRLNGECGVHFFDDHGSAVAAIATLFIALFTFTLWQATKKLWLASTKALETAERAYVFVKEIKTEITTAEGNSESITKLLNAGITTPPRFRITRFAAIPIWRNSGSTPAKEITIKVDWWQDPDGNFPPEYSYRHPPAPPTFIAPKADEIGEVVEIPGTQSLVNFGLQGIGVQPIIIIWGRADYKDVFGRSHFTQFCYRLRMEDHRGNDLRASFVQWGDYNRTDDSA
jgi:hypothetical protein